MAAHIARHCAIEVQMEVAVLLFTTDQLTSVPIADTPMPMEAFLMAEAEAEEEAEAAQTCQK